MSEWTRGRGIVTAIRVQDTKNHIWFNWDNGVWDGYTPKIPAGSSVYIAAYAVDADETGLPVELSLGVYVADQLIESTLVVVPPGQGVGVECNLPMPNKKTLVQIKAGVLEPIDVVSFYLTPLTAPNPDEDDEENTWILAALGIIGVAAVGGLVYATRNNRNNSARDK